MRRFAALAALALNLIACKVEAEDPKGFEPGMAVEPEPMEDTACETLVRCFSSARCDFDTVLWCDMPENADDEQCATADADLEACIEMCAAEHPDASDDDVMLAVAAVQCNAAIITAEDAVECTPLDIECNGGE